MKIFINMLRDDSGAAAAEYALILAIIGSGIAFAAFNLGGAIKDSMATSANCLANQTDGSTPEATGCA